MNKPLHEKEIFTALDYSGKRVQDANFDSCTFRLCNFSKSDLTNVEFLDCLFDGCDFSLARMNNTGLKNVSFNGCKLLGIDFSKCRDFLLSFTFKKSILDYAVFRQKKIRNTLFLDCSVKEVDFSAADLTAALFQNCDLARSTFFHTILEQADFRTSVNYYFDLEQNSVKKAKFSAAGIIGLLDKYNIIIE